MAARTAHGGQRRVFFSGAHAGTAPVTCAVLEGGLTEAHYCGIAGPPTAGQGTWRTTYGLPSVFAYPGALGFGNQQKTCVLYRRQGGVDKLLGLYYTGADRACDGNTAASDHYVEGEYFTSPG